MNDIIRDELKDMTPCAHCGSRAPVAVWNTAEGMVCRDCLRSGLVGVTMVAVASGIGPEHRADVQSNFTPAVDGVTVTIGLRDGRVIQIGERITVLGPDGEELLDVRVPLPDLTVYAALWTSQPEPVAASQVQADGSVNFPATGGLGTIVAAWVSDDAHPESPVVDIPLVGDPRNLPGTGTGPEFCEGDEQDPCRHLKEAHGGYGCMVVVDRMDGDINVHFCPCELAYDS